MTSRPSDPSEPEQLSPEEEAELSALIRAAWRPSALSDAKNAALVALALEDPFAEPSPDELVESERLRRALEGDGEHPHAALARALQAATQKTSEPERASELIDDVVLARGTRARVYTLFGATAAILALAASVLLVLRPAERRAESASVAQTQTRTSPRLLAARSTQELFNEKFDTNDTSARIDRIAAVRARELRANRYAAWGVR